MIPDSGLEAKAGGPRQWLRTADKIGEQSRQVSCGSRTPASRFAKATQDRNTGVGFDGRVSHRTPVRRFDDGRTTAVA